MRRDSSTDAVSGPCPGVEVSSDNDNDIINDIVVCAIPKVSYLTRPILDATWWYMFFSINPRKISGCTNTHAHANAHTHTHTHTHAHINTHAHAHAYKDTCTHAHAHAHAHAHSDTHARTHARMRIHVHMHSCTQNESLMEKEQE